MARRASRGAAAGGKGGIGSIFRIPTGVKRTIFAFFFICLGGLLFNLDRMGNADVALLKYKNFLPGIVRRFLPGGTAAQGSAVPAAGGAGGPGVVIIEW